MRIALRGFMAVVLVLASLGARAQAEIDAQPALTAAEAWLAMMDSGSYGAAWETAAPALRESMTKLQWETGLEKARGPLGVVVARKLRKADYVPAGAAAESYVIQYDTRFEARPLTTEILSVTRRGEGAWRVSAYVLR